MRKEESSGPFRVRAISGTRVVLLAWDLDPSARAGLHGFAIKRQFVGSTQPAEWLRGLKYFSSLVPAPVKGATYSSRHHPFQTFLWSDYEVYPGTAFTFTVVALYGSVASLEERHSVSITIRTEKENDSNHGVWFNRGAIASHGLAAEFKNKPITPEMFNKVDAAGQLVDKEVRWLSRGLAEACLDFIHGTQAGEGLRVCAYEFTYAPVLNALRDALSRGVDVRIVYHDTKKPKDPNEKAIGSAGIPLHAKIHGKTEQVLFKRTRTKIPHNKFIVKVVGGKPREVWTGSTNFTDTGFFGQTNVGHLVSDDALAKTYLDYWLELTQDPTLSNAVKAAVDLTPNPANVLASASVSCFYSPRIADNMLDWYAQRVQDAAALAVITIPFTVAPAILKGLSKQRPALRLAILEDEPTKEVLEAEKANHGRLAFSNGAILGKSVIKYRTGVGGAKVAPIPHSPLDQWFIDEELARPTNRGHVFFVHSKFLLVDPLSDDPLICSGSANFSKNSLVANDENMLLVRGDKRVADIYFTEFDRIFRHFYARDAINRAAKRGERKNPLELDTKSQWIEPNYTPGTYKSNRRLLFFPDPAAIAAAKWSVAAGTDGDPFADEAKRAQDNRRHRSATGGAKKTAKGAVRKNSNAGRKHPARKTPSGRSARGPKTANNRPRT